MKSEESVLARMVSKIFEPMMVFLALALIGGWHAHLRGPSFSSYALYIASVGVLVTIGRVRLMRLLRTNWDVSNRSKRVRTLLFLLAGYLIVYWSMALWHNHVLSDLFALFVAWLVGFFFVTLRVKISGHLAVFVLALGLLVQWYEMSLWVLAVLIPLLAWSRVKLKRHTVPEVILGTVYSCVILFVYYRLPR